MSDTDDCMSQPGLRQAGKHMLQSIPDEFSIVGANVNNLILVIQMETTDKILFSLLRRR